MSNPLRISRDVLAKFLPDDETIRKFEQLVLLVDQINTTSVEELQTETGIALQKANEAIDRFYNIFASSIKLDVAGFNGILSASDINVQLALDTIDDIDTDDVPEGAVNFYFTDERSDDSVARLIQDGTGIAWVYDDTAGTLTGNTVWNRTGTLLNPSTSTDDVEWSAFKYLDATTGGATNMLIGDTENTTLTGTGNMFAGYQSGKNATTSARNVGYGPYTLKSNTTGVGNTAMGSNSLVTNVNGNNNVAAGQNSMQYNVSGKNNTGIGLYALRNNVSGDNNLGLGSNALYSNTSGGSNLAFGGNALYSNTTGAVNAAGGFSSLRSNTIGGSNAAYGANSMYSNVDGDNNLAIGTRSLYFNVSGSNNTALGYYAGQNVTGSDNVLIGSEAAKNATSISNQLWIANSATTTPLIYGEFDNSFLKVNGGFGAKLTSVSSTYPILRGDYTINCTANTFTVTLPTAVGYEGQMYNIKNTGTGTITIATTSSQTIDGSTTVTITKQYTNVPVQSDGANWVVL